MSVQNEELVKQMLKHQAASKANNTGVPGNTTKSGPTAPVAGDGEKLFSEVFGFAPPSKIDHAVRVFGVEDWHESIRCHIPRKDPDYIWPKRQLEWFVVGLMQNDRQLLHGPKGTGKSTLPEQVCAHLNIPYLRVNGRGDMESNALFGSITVVDGSFVWTPGPAEELGRHGGLLQVDEISAIPASINMAMQWMLEKPGKIFLADKPGSSEDKMLDQHEWFRIVATDNTQLQGDTTGRYAGTAVQNEALIDRLSNVIELDYLGRSHERKIIEAKCPDLDSKIVEQMLDLAGLIRAGIKQGSVDFGLSIRTMISWGEKAAYWNDVGLGLKLSFYNKLIDEDKEFVNEAAHKVFSINLSK